MEKIHENENLISEEESKRQDNGVQRMVGFQR
jgi:hypothetical protein